MKRLFLLVLVALSGALTAWAGDYVELLTNGACDGTYDGWEKINGGDGWAIGQDEDGSSYWASSYLKCTLSQTIVLSEKNFSNEDIDAGNVICIASAMIKAIWDPKNYGRASTVAIVRVEMLDDSNNVLSTITVLDDNSIFLEWTLFKTDEFILVSGTRKLKFIVEGQDSAYWLGQFGPCFKNLSLQVKNDGNGHDCEVDGHIWGDWVVTTEPTCTENGAQSHTCTYCGLTLYVAIEALGHDWNDEGICNRCGIADYRPWGKEEGGWCGRPDVNDGRNVYYFVTKNDNNEKILTICKSPQAVGDNCDIADYNYSQNNPQPWIDIEYLETGGYTVQMTIDHIFIGEGVTGVGALTFQAHKESTVVIPSTLKRIGEFSFHANHSLTDIYCHATPTTLDWNNTRTSDFKSGKGTTMHVYAHFLDTYQQKFGDANVTYVGDLNQGGAIRDCSFYGHVWSEMTQITDPTCTETGLLVHTCIFCNKTETEPIPALDHEWNNIGKCERCGMSRADFDEVTLLDAIESTGEQAFNTGYIHKNNTIVEMDCLVKQNQDRNYEALFGARLGNYKNNAFCFFSRFNGKDIPCFNRSGKETIGEDDFVYDDRIILWASYDNIAWFRESNPLYEVGSIYTTGTSDDGKTPMFLFNLNTANTEGGVQADISPCSMKLYSCKIYEDGDLIHNYVPAKKDGVVGLYDLTTGAFGGSITDTPFLGEGEKYPITVTQRGAIIEVDGPNKAMEGDLVKVNLTYPDKNLLDVKVTGENDKPIDAEILHTDGYRTYVQFTMPDCPVTISIVTQPDIIYDIPDDCEIRRYLRNSSNIYMYAIGPSITADFTTGKISIAFAPDGTVYMENPMWYLDERNVWVKGTYDEATGIISIPTGQYLTWSNEYQYGAMVCWGSSSTYWNEEAEGYYMAYMLWEDVKTIDFLVDGDDLYLLNAQGNLCAEFPECYNATGMTLLYDDDHSLLSLEFPNVDDDGNQLPFATINNVAPAIPANPVISWFDCGDESGYSKIMFTMPTTDINGNPIDRDYLSYSIFIDNGNGPELFVFLASVYQQDLDYDVTEIPCRYEGYDFHSNLVYFYRTNADGFEPFFKERIGMQVYYTVDGVRNQTNIVWYDNPDGINEIKADQSDNDDKIYNLAGQRLGKMQKGVNIINGKKVLK